MKRIVEFIILLVLIDFGFTFCVKDPAPEELGTSINIVFPPPPPVYGTDTDQGGNTFTTVEFGNQIWMAENLKTTKYNDGTPIPNVTTWSQWSDLSKGAYCWYDNDSLKNKSEYGAIYNGYAVMTGKLCPAGWHVPEKSEWVTLITHLGGNKEAGGKLKESGTTHWNSPNRGSTNLSGFTALPGGIYCMYYRVTVNITCRSYIPFNSIRLYSEWWSCTTDSNLDNSLYILGLDYSKESIWGLGAPVDYGGYHCIEYGREMFNGCYVRCIKDK